MVNSKLCLSPPRIYITVSRVSCTYDKVIAYCPIRLDVKSSILCACPVFRGVDMRPGISQGARKMRNIACFLGVYAIFLGSLALCFGFAYSVIDKVVMGFDLEAQFFASCLWVSRRIMAKCDCCLICASVNYTTTVEHYCAVKGTIWIGKIHASSIGGCIPGFRRLHLSDQTAASLTIGVIRLQEKPTVASTHFLLIFG